MNSSVVLQTHTWLTAVFITIVIRILISDSLTEYLFKTCSGRGLNVSLRVCCVMKFHPSLGNRSANILFLKQSHAFNEL